MKTTLNTQEFKTLNNEDLMTVDGGIGIFAAVCICAGCFVVGAVAVAGVCFLVNG